MLDRKELRALSSRVSRVGQGWGVDHWSRLADLRESGVTQPEAARQLGCAVGTVSRKWTELREECRRLGVDDPGPWADRERQRPPLRQILERI